MQSKKSFAGERNTIPASSLTRLGMSGAASTYTSVYRRRGEMNSLDAEDFLSSRGREQAVKFEGMRLPRCRMSDTSGLIHAYMFGSSDILRLGFQKVKKPLIG